MKSSSARVVLFAAGALVACDILPAHHGAVTSYANSKTFTTRATVTRFRYINPHPQLDFDVQDEHGQIVHWSGEIAPNPAQLMQAGWGRSVSRLHWLQEP